MMNETRTKLLIVDDLPENLRALNALIRENDRSVYQASSGEEALALLLEHDFALAILDVQMPEMDGFELAQLMRGTDKTRHIPIVFVTAAGKEMNFSFQGYESGAVDFLHKPLDINAVQSKVNVFVALHQQRAETRRQVQALEHSRQQQEALLQELRATQAELQRSLRMRDEFMSMVAHELRTPLNTLLLESQLRKMQLDRGNTAIFDAVYLQKMVARDQRQIKSMVRLIDDMVDVSRIRSNRLSIQPAEVDLSVLLERVVGDFSSHSPIQISLARAQDGVQLDVQDYGIGISEDNQKRIFMQFERVQGNDGTGGLGLGLFITRQLVEAHGGHIGVKSCEDEGTVFSVTLPLSAPLELAV